VSTPVLAGESTFGAVDAESGPFEVLSPNTHEASDKTVKATKLNFTMFFMIIFVKC
jgi:hypothetical protein